MFGACFALGIKNRPSFEHDDAIERDFSRFGQRERAAYARRGASHVERTGDVRSLGWKIPDIHRTRLVGELLDVHCHPIAGEFWRGAAADQH